MLLDSYGREINYVRLAVTDRCNLRCVYCMPAKGLNWINRKDLLSLEETTRLLNILATLGIRKVRFTGGEPFLRKDFMDILRATASLNSFETITLTTNGTLTHPHISEMKALGVSSVNLSADTFNTERFFKMTRRNDLDAVIKTFHSLLDHGIKTKINAVVMENKNEEDIIELSKLAQQYPVDIRFIEEMPFNGDGKSHAAKWNFIAITDHLKAHYPEMHRLPFVKSATSYDYEIPGFLGKVGIIAAYSRTFCGTCNRIRITPQGDLKTCLYDDASTHLIPLLRSNSSDSKIADIIRESIAKKPVDGHEAERMRNPVNESMATIGG